VLNPIVPDKVVVAPAHKSTSKLVVKIGVGSTVIVRVAVEAGHHEPGLGTVYVIVAVPGAIPATTPFDVTIVATPVLLVDQVPPGVVVANVT
jgi:hypothetical protein